MLRQTPRTFVEQLDFRSTVGQGDGPGRSGRRLGLSGAGVTVVVTDLGVLEPDPETRELTMTALHPGVTAGEARAASAWPLCFADELETCPPPSEAELTALRALRYAGEDPA